MNSAAFWYGELVVFPRWPVKDNQLPIPKGHEPSGQRAKRGSRLFTYFYWFL